MTANFSQTEFEMLNDIYEMIINEYDYYRTLEAIETSFNKKINSFKFNDTKALKSYENLLKMYKKDIIRSINTPYFRARYERCLPKTTRAFKKDYRDYINSRLLDKYMEDNNVIFDYLMNRFTRL